VISITSFFSLNNFIKIIKRPIINLYTFSSYTESKRCLLISLTFSKILLLLKNGNDKEKEEEKKLEEVEKEDEEEDEEDEEKD
jgi:hypothetical protein